MKKKRILSACIAFALQTGSYSAIAENNDIISPKKKCPANISALSQQEKEKLPKECLNEDSRDMAWGLAIGGIVTVVAGTALALHTQDGGSPSENGGIAPDGGDTPDNGGDKPDNGGDKPDDGGDTPDDGGDTPPTPPDTSVTQYNNEVVLDRGNDTVRLDNLAVNGDYWESATFSYAPSANGNAYTLSAADGTELLVDDWYVTDDNNAVFGGTTADNLFWKYDSRGNVILASANTQVINQDNATNHQTDDLSASGAYQTGTIISGDGTTNTVDSNINASDGATGYIISGDDTTNTFNGSDASDGGTGILISGNGTVTTLTGTTSTTDGGQGVFIDGDHATLNNEGDVSAEGSGSAGLIVSGDDSVFINSGDINADDGGVGVMISGNNGLIYNSGIISASGDGSIGMALAGNSAHVIQNGDLEVTDGAWGILAYGEHNLTANTGNATVRDEGSVGFVVAGKENIFGNTGDLSVSLNGTGALVSGDHAQVNLDGNINVDSVQDSNGIYRGATGVSIEGDNDNMVISGNVNVNALFPLANDNVSFNDTLTGVTISGSDNNVQLKGELDITVNDKSFQEEPGDSAFSSVGLNIAGKGNNVEILGGININFSQSGDINDDMYSRVTGININGANTLTLSGHSTLNAATSMNYGTTLANVQNGGKIILDENSVLDINMVTVPFYYGSDDALLQADGQASSIENKGTINNKGGASLFHADNGAEIDNYGTLNSWINEPARTPEGVTTEDRSVNMVASGTGSQVENNAGGTITIRSSLSPADQKWVEGNYPHTWYENTYYAMLAIEGGSVVNNEGASISLAGAGLYGVSATNNGTARNEGTINVDGFQQQLDDDGNITGETYWHTNHTELPSSGMAAGSDVQGYGDGSVVTNTGTITVKNAGYGMEAMHGGTAINQGTINLEADAGITGTDPNQLVGMAALMGGVVINDTTGIININADYGHAFYSDGTGYVVNHGAINLNGTPMDDADPHMGTTPTDQTWLQALAGSGDSITKTSDTGFFTTETLANYGTITLNGDVDINGWLYNEPDATLTVKGNLNITTNSGGTENHGTLNADTITTAHSLFNEADGSITTDLLTINSGSTFFNDGNFTGAIAGTSYQQNIVNTGSMTVAEDGKSLVSGSFRFYNQQGATLSNSGIATEGGENTIINVTRANDSLSQVNSGTITATNGYSAITTVNGSNNPVWIWNTETGVINGINPDAPLINLGRGYSFGNEGTINVQGDNAVAISGGTSSYTINLVNSGTINVGTEQGKADGTNGTGLIGIKGNGNATTIDNAADGVINVYADNSYAFGGTTKAIINNGEINLLCDTGCGIYAPGTTGTHADGTADIAIPDAATAPSKGNLPAPPADPNAPQMLSNYIVGTNADGSSGTLKANNLVIGDNVKVGTGFTAGTAETTVVVDNAFTGSNIQGAENIASTSVVWTAQGSNDASGNVDVTMTKNAYADVATDGSVSGVAQALDAGYTNNELYTSLNVGTTAELNDALKQVSGSQATTVFREARVLSNRFNMLAGSAPQIGSDGLAFNVVAKGDPRAELGNDARYDMLALRQKLDLTESQTLALEYGIARIDGNGSQSAGDNGVTGGYSQFFGLKHSMALNDDGLSWNNTLRYDVHNLDSSRSVSYGDTSKVADSDARQQNLEFRSEGAKTFTLDEGLTVTPYAGVKFRHTMEDGYRERSAGDFNLTMNAGQENAVDSIVGLKLNYTGKMGWSANATLEGGPNLSYAKSQRTASLQGAAGQHFSVDDGQRGGGVNGLATVGVKYQHQGASLNLDAYQWKEDGISDKGFMLNLKKAF